VLVSIRRRPHAGDSDRLQHIEKFAQRRAIARFGRTGLTPANTVGKQLFLQSVVHHDRIPLCGYPRQLRHDDLIPCGRQRRPLVAKTLDWSAADLKSQSRGTARYITLVNGQPTSPTLLETEKAAIATGFLQSNISRTRNRYSRPRTMVEDELSRSISSSSWPIGGGKKSKRKRSPWG
jgi:hypothetical protein